MQRSCSGARSGYGMNGKWG
uniref:Uncharacterized protein n=1 Tax=Arundo donax TaxID=35708 RepID=A0A0A9H153_ARUDO